MVARVAPARLGAPQPVLREVPGVQQRRAMQVVPAKVKPQQPVMSAQEPTQQALAQVPPEARAPQELEQETEEQSMSPLETAPGKEMPMAIVPAGLTMPTAV